MYCPLKDREICLSSSHHDAELLRCNEQPFNDDLIHLVGTRPDVSVSQLCIRKLFQKDSKCWEQGRTCTNELKNGKTKE